MTAYTFFCADHGVERPFPAKEQNLLVWVAEMAEMAKHPKNIKAYLTGVRSAQLDMGMGNLEVFSSPILKRVIDDVKRLRGEGDRKERREITKPILAELVATFDRDTLHGATMYAAFCLAFAGFLRVGEFTWDKKNYRKPRFQEFFCTRRSVRLNNQSLTLTLPASKTDPWRRGVSLQIAASNDATCPVAAMRYLFENFPASQDSPLFHPDRPFTRKLVVDTLNAALRQIGQPGRYSGHSFRRGAATSAKAAGLSADEIKLLGRWKSDAWERYVEVHPDHIFEMSRRHQGTASPHH